MEEDAPGSFFIKTSYEEEEFEKIVRNSRRRAQGRTSWELLKTLKTLSLKTLPVSKKQFKMKRK